MQMKDRDNLDQKYIGGPFDRQVRIEDWDQETLSKQTVLVLGIGGLGSVVVSSLLRLGIGAIYMVDYDVVDIHNLNRQILFTNSDIGKPKVQAAQKNAQFHNAGNTKMQIFHGNALTNWQKIVQFARKSTFVYNCIDWGDKFDMAVTSLCLKLEIPLVMGGTFSTSLTVDFFPSKGRPCYLCSQSIVQAPDMWEKISPSVIAELEDISFLPKNNNPVGRSSMVVCTICGQMMVAHLLNWLFLSEQKPYKASRVIFYHNTFEIVKFELEQFKKCPFCATPEDIIEFQKEELKKKEQQEERKKKEEEEKRKKKEEEESEKKEEEEKKEDQKGNEQNKEKEKKTFDTVAEKPGEKDNKEEVQQTLSPSKPDATTETSIKVEAKLIE